MIKCLKKLFKPREVEENSREIGNDLEEKFFRYKKLVENNIFGYDKVDVANYLLRVVVENLNFLEAVQAFESEHGVQNNLLIEEIYRRIASEVEVDIRSITIDNIHKDDIKYNLKGKLKCRDPIKININELPILLNPWNGERIIDNLMRIGEKNIFDCVKYSLNIENHYLYPMNIVVCSGGNHSQLSAKIKNQGGNYNKGSI